MRCAPAWPTSSETDFSKRAALDAWVAHVLTVVEGLTAIPNVVMLVRTAEGIVPLDVEIEGAALLTLSR